ncbi:MAG: FecR domain-containing protein [Bacteroidota bacterium]
MQTEKDKFKQVDANLVERYLEGGGSKKEQLQIEEWFSDLQANEELRKFSKNRWEDRPEEPKETTLSGYDEERMHDRIHHIMRLEDAAIYQKERRRSVLIRFLTRAAAVLFIPIALFALFNWKGNISGSESFSQAEIFSPFGARTSFMLPDGSSGWLNGGSTLSFPTQFKGKSRTVKLTGEAYFDVRENPKKHFTVLAGEMKVRAYGTSFNVMAYPDDMTVEVTLETGVVEVFGKDRFNNEKTMGLMAPGERGVLIEGTGYSKKDIVKVDQYTSWKEGRLVLRNESMNQVVSKLNRWYNVNIVIRDSRLESYTYRATFEDEKLDEVLKILKRTSPIVCKELRRKRYPDGTYGKRTIELYYHAHN